MLEPTRRWPGVRRSKKKEPSEEPEMGDGRGEGHDEADPTEEILEWAKTRVAAVSEGAPGVMGPAEGITLDPEGRVSAPESAGSRSEAERRTRFEAAPRPSNDETPMRMGEGKLLVVMLAGNSAQNGEAHFFDDRERAGRFIAAKVEDGLDLGRIRVFWGMPMNMTYRTVVAIGQPEQQAPEAK